MAVDFNLRKVKVWFSSISARERMIVSFTGVALLIAAIAMPLMELEDYLATEKRLVASRTRDLEAVGRVTSRYKVLNERLKKLQETFDSAQMTFEQLTVELDKVVKGSIGSDDYSLVKTRSPSKIGFDYDKQEFTLKVKSLSLEQLTKLLYELEQGESPLFLGKVDLAKLPNKESFSATLEIFSVRKSS
jgi:hypothetical protein